MAAAVAPAAAVSAGAPDNLRRHAAGKKNRTCPGSRRVPVDLQSTALLLSYKSEMSCKGQVYDMSRASNTASAEKSNFITFLF